MARANKTSHYTDRVPFAASPKSVLQTPLAGWASSWGLRDDASWTDLLERQSDPTWVRRGLEALTPLSLVALEALLEAGGQVELSELRARVAERHGAAPIQVGIAIASLEQRGWLLSIQYTSDEHDRPRAMATEPAASLAAPLLRGLSDPPEPPTPPSDAMSLGDAAELAVAGWVCHVKLRCTKAGGPHRTDVKKLAKRLSFDPKRLLELFESAEHLGLLREGPDRYDADPARMRAYARGAVVPSDLEQRVRDWLSDGPRPMTRIVTELAATVPSPLWTRPDPEKLRAEAIRELDRMRGLLRFESQGRTWLAQAAPAPELPDRAEGFVTPNLQVMVGPAPDPRVVAVVSLAAELTQLDHVLTFRLRPETVAQAALRGISGEVLVDVLDRIGRHPLPESVRAQVLDWAGSARIARGVPMMAFQVPPRHVQAALSRLGEGARAVGEGTILTPLAGVEEAAARLSEAGFACHLDWSSLEARDEEDEEWADAPLPFGAPDDALRARVRQDREGDWRASRGQVPPRPPRVDDFWEVMEGVTRDLPPSARTAFSLLLRERERVMPEVEAWVAARAEPADVQAMLEDPTLILPMLFIAPHQRRKILNSGVGLAEGWALAREQFQAGRLSPGGRKIEKAMKKSGLGDALASVLLQGEEVRTEEEIAEIVRAHVGSDSAITISWVQRGAIEIDEVWIDEVKRRPDGREVVLWTDAARSISRAVPMSSIRGVMT